MIDGIAGVPNDFEKFVGTVEKWLDKDLRIFGREGRVLVEVNEKLSEEEWSWFSDCFKWACEADFLRRWCFIDFVFWSPVLGNDTERCVRSGVRSGVISGVVGVEGENSWLWLEFPGFWNRETANAESFLLK